MVKHQLHIVGLPYSDVGINLDEFFAEIGEDARLTLRPEPNNPVDALAIRGASTPHTPNGIKSIKIRIGVWEYGKNVLSL